MISVHEMKSLPYMFQSNIRKKTCLAFLYCTCHCLPGLKPEKYVIISL
jgi:hypothetical protein